MQLKQTQSIKIGNAAQKQQYSILILKSGTVVSFFSQDDDCYVEWFGGNENVQVKVEEIAWDVFETPAFFHFGNHVGVYSSKNDFVVLYDEAEKHKAIKMPVKNKLPEIAFPSFNKPLSNYHRAGVTDNNVIPVLFTSMGLLPVYIGELHLDLEKSSATWSHLKHWNNQAKIDLQAESFVKPAKSFAVLHALNKQGVSYAYGIGDRESGYLKPGMEYSEMAVIDENGLVKETLFSLGRLYKESKKGGKECLFTSSGKYAILTPVYKADDWKNKQKLFELDTRQLIDVELPEGLSGYRIIDHHNDRFLLADNYTNLIFANTEELVLCEW
jgi:hypothetical protein